MEDERRTPAIELLCEDLRTEIARILNKADERELRIVYQFVKPIDK